jgi:hypothetical protein
MAQVPSYVPTNGLVGWWPFNGNANDESGNGNNGTVNGASLTSDRFGNSNHSFNFDGIGNNITTNFIFPTGNQPKSFSLWFTTNHINDRTWIISNNLACNAQNSQDKGFGLFMDGDPNNGGSSQTPSLIFNGMGQNSDLYFLNTYFSASNWYHIVVTYDGSVLNSFFNGVYNNSISVTLNTIGNNVLFGSRTNPYVNGCPEEYHDGKIDDIGIWNRALTECEIADLYNAQLGSFSNATISTTPTSSTIGSSATLTVSTPIQNLQWQSNPGNMGWNNIVNNNTYSGSTNDTLVVSNLQLSNHNQPFRVLACGDTSNVATIQIADTCITNVTVYDTLLTTVTDTLIINTTLSLPAPNNENAILIYPNPASDHITIDNGNYSAMAGYSIKITNNAGQEVFLNAINQQQFYVDLSTWTGNSLYFVHLIDSQNNTVTVRKIVLQ